MTNIDEFNINDCKKIDPNCVNAYVDFHLDPDNDTGLCLDTSWGGECLDLEGIVKAGETCTSLYLSPEENPNCLVYEGECENYCINGDDLSRIISMQYLKDVDQETAPQNGDVYMYRDGKFYTFDLQSFVTNTGNAITNLQNSVNNLQTRVTNLENSVRPIVNRFEEFTNVPSNAKIMLGNINLYSDTNAVVNGSGTATSLDKSHGIYGHALNQDKAQDELFG